MNTFFTAVKRPFFQIILITGFLLAACSSEEPNLNISGNVIERIDIVLEENTNKEYIYLESEESNKLTDLVDYNFYGLSSTKMDFKVKLDDRRTLIFKIVNKLEPNFWELENSTYSIHPNADLSSIYKYVTAEIVSGGETSYTTSLGALFPSKIQFDVFRITKFDLVNYEMVVHIENFEIAQVSSLNAKTLSLNGTFRGSITFNK